MADTEFGLHLLRKSSQGDENTFSFGGGLTGHHGKINDMTFCGGRGEDSSRYLATVSGWLLALFSSCLLDSRIYLDDKMLMVWDLQPPVEPPFREQSSENEDRNDRPRPTAYVIAFPNPLTTVNSHPSTSKEFLVSDSHGSIFLTDWRSDPQEMDQDVWRHSSLLELVEPSALYHRTMDSSTRWSASVAWRRDTSDM